MGHGSHAASPKNSSSPAAMGTGMGKGKCKISMLFNLNTIDSCFLSDRWRITSAGMFAGSCIGVFLLTVALELLRRSIKEYDRFLVRQHLAKFQASTAAAAAAARAEGESVSSKDVAVAARASCAAVPPLRPSVLQQAVRAFLHLLQFTCAYILMLLAMYYNGYLLLCIFLGAYFGAFIFQWENLPLGGQQTSAAEEATVCCG
ncbi:ctr copper transporter family protein [Hirsutella rhossiliensis]|uniref:Copper transport protein n=1 Tax=Hirsutella rhossiliensis TaxID=111463 RepID=A0A9P8MW64_9HYPO|nr:ctr copper transporter family domain-containing protein [Hirsutella rhossiliensis]KAH0962304.1 ctr copper transporter family domain-containing protein [Hirsutella rhossiliensis]